MKKYWLNCVQLCGVMSLNNKQEFIDRMKLIDEMIIDQTPLADRFAGKYNKKFK